MNHTQQKKAAPGKARPEVTTNAGQSISPRNAAQLHFKGFPPPPERGEGTVEAYLRARPGWHGRMNLCAVLQLPDRELRLQAEFSDGLIIFGSGKRQGLKHTIHADAWERRACAAELRYRAMSHLRRADEVEKAGQREGGAS